MARIRERRLPSGRVIWELDHGSGAHRVRIKAGYSREEARTMLAQFERQLGLHGGPPEAILLHDAIDAYDHFLEQNRRPRTRGRYVRVLRTFAHCFLARHHPETVRLREVRPSHIDEYKTRRAAGEIVDEARSEDSAREQALHLELAQVRRKERPLERGRFGWLGRHGIRARVSHRTINYELNVLTTFFRWAIKKNYAFIDPGTNVEKFRIPKRSIPRFMTADELKQFFAACGDADRRLFMAILLSGMRKGEVEHLTWADVNLGLSAIFIREHAAYGWLPKTEERIIPISPVLRQVLLEQWDHRTGDTLVFPNTAGNVDTDILERLKRICRKAGIRVATVHALRHSFGAHLRMAGVSLADIADLMGHRDLATTQIYAKVVQEHLRLAAAKLAPLVQLEAQPPLPDGRKRRMLSAASTSDKAN
jgi:integrase/recombinase XerD